MKQYTDQAMQICKKRGADYADIRIVEITREELGVRNGELSAIENYKSFGYGIRVIMKGAWGYAAAAGLDPAGIKAAAEKAVEIALASSRKINKKVRLAPEPVYIDRWQSPYVVDPFNVSPEEKLNLLFEIDKILRKNKKIKNALSLMNFEREHQWFANLDGSFINQQITRSGAGYEATAVDGGESQRRSFPCTNGQFVQAGYEVIPAFHLLENAEKTREEAISLLSAKPCPAGEKELIIMGSQLALQIHESIGHATELDRVLGLEANYAGRSFVTLEKKGNFRYGSKLMNIVADSTCPTGLGTFGYDDDGVRPERYHVIKDGIFQTYLTNREFAHEIGEKRSRGCNRADGWENIPIVRMPNLSLMPGDAKLDQLIADTRDGILVDGVKCWSIDQYRSNFQFGMEMGWEIKKGKITGIVKDPTYQSITPVFWGNLNAICDESHWTLWGVFNCGKGQPGQRAEMSHGCAPARFSKVTVGVQNAR
ncbi:MAG: TldD/PmbA family protein [Candidatus Wallbacteria bacterium]|nr:TldD/PmbA family protein [Candidatus Wallbacteria bacterium]